MFVHVITGRTSNAQAVRRCVDTWEREFRPGVAGYLGCVWGIATDGRYVEVAQFESEEAADAIRLDPRIDGWKDEIRSCLGDVEFHDGTDVFEVGGGLDHAAGFVQIMRGRVTDRETLSALLVDRETFEKVVSPARPDILGVLFILHADDTFTETVCFTSETEAREHEGAALPPDAQQMLDALAAAITVEEFIDFPEPSWVS